MAAAAFLPPVGSVSQRRRRRRLAIPAADNQWHRCTCHRPLDLMESVCNGWSVCCHACIWIMDCRVLIRVSCELDGMNKPGVYEYYWRPTTDSMPIHTLLKILNDHDSATRHPIRHEVVGFSGTADRTAPFPVWSNPRWRPAIILKNFKWPYLSNA